MKYLYLLLTLFFILALVAGCAKKPVAYVPKDAKETAVADFAKQKKPGFVIVKISAPLAMPMPAGRQLPAGMKMPTPPYMVQMADSGDATKLTTVLVVYDETTGKAEDMAGPPMMPGRPAPAK